jgi:hypothetical protein
MKHLLNTKHVFAAFVAALLAGILWLIFWKDIGNVSLSEIRGWLAPLIVAWAIIGVSVGVIGKRNDKTVPFEVDEVTAVQE